MNREIRFRGYGVDNKGWFYGDLLQCADDYPSIVGVLDDDMIENMLPEDNEIGDDFQERVDLKTVGQYTGLKDKNGVEIYEGDSMRRASKYDIERILEVRFGNYNNLSIYPDSPYLGNGWHIKLVLVLRDGMPSSADTLGGVCGLLDSDNGKGEVIGTIHDNPELLEKAK